MNIVNEKDIGQIIKADKIFGFINKTYGHPPDWTRPPGFVSLAKIILEQQVSLASANAHFLRLSNYLTGFSPENILSLKDEELRNCQISRQKAKYLRELSAAIVSGELNLEKLRDQNEYVVREQLTRIKGIGDWTADVYLMFCLQSKNIFPATDIAIVNTVRELTNAKTKEEIIKLADRWQPVRSLATYYLWHYYLSKKGKINKL
jgi:DNA-3-methyladenine glycosylase II